MSRYFWCRLLHFCVIYVSYVLLMYGTVILFWVRMWRIFFSNNVIWSDVEPAGSWRLDFWHVSFGTSVRRSDVEPPGFWPSDFGPPVSWPMSVIVSPSLWLIQPHGGTNLILLLALWIYSCLMAVWWLSGWCLVNNTFFLSCLVPSKWRIIPGVFNPSVELAMPDAVELPVSIGVEGFLWLNYSSVVRSGIVVCPLWKIIPI